MGWVKTEKTNKLSKLGDIDFTTTAPVNGNALVYDETNDVWVPGEGGGSSGVELTQAEYDLLTSTEKNNGSIYKITDKAKIYCLDEEYHAVKEITSADYALLTNDEKNNGTLYIITDEETTAADIPYSAGVSVADKLDSLTTPTISSVTWETTNVSGDTSRTSVITLGNLVVFSIEFTPLNGRIANNNIIATGLPIPNNSVGSASARFVYSDKGRQFAVDGSGNLIWYFPTVTNDYSRIDITGVYIK